MEFQATRRLKSDKSVLTEELIGRLRLEVQGCMWNNTIVVTFKDNNGVVCGRTFNAYELTSLLLTAIGKESEVTP